MAVPSSGELSLQKIANEKNDNDYNSTDPEMVQNGNISLRGLSSNSHNDSGGGNINFVTSNVTASIPTSGEISFSDFYGATYAAGSFHTTTLTVGTTGGYGYALSGFKDANSIGSLGDATLTYNGRAVTITDLSGNFTSTTVSTGTVKLRIDDDLATTSAPNSGWTSIKFYFNQTNNSGSPDQTLTRASATYTASGGVGVAAATWEWTVAGSMGGAGYGTWFGGTNGAVHFVEMI